MKRKKKSFFHFRPFPLILSFTFYLLTFSFSAFALDKPFDHSAWDTFLKRFVNEKGEVDYQGVLKEPELLEDYLKQLAVIDDYDLNYHWPREEKMALWINAYHAGVVKVLSEHYPVKSIQNIPSVWDTDAVQVAGKKFGLNTIRVKNLMSKFRDEKIHTALACGARGCPRLRRDAYTGPRIEGQLFLAAREFVNDAEFNQMIPGEKKIRISRLFKWHQPDFSLDFGVQEEEDQKFEPAEYAVLSFLAHYLDDPQKVDFLEGEDFKIDYPPFDWSLNEWNREEKNASVSPASK